MTEPFPLRPPPAPGPRRKDYTIVVVLVILAAVAAILWFADPAHQCPGNSRVDCPAPAPAKP